MKANLLALCIFFALGSHAQVRLRGIVRDHSTERPLANVVLGNPDGIPGSITSENGRFNIEVDSLPADLEFRLIGYETVRITVKIPGVIQISMMESAHSLPVAEIEAELGEQTVAGTRKSHIWDYAWLGDQLLVCEYTTSLARCRLILLTPEGDTIDQASCPGRPLRLFNDCLGNAHVQGKDSTWQIILENHKIEQLPGHENNLIEHLLLNCAASDSANLYFTIPAGSGKFDNKDPGAFTFMTRNHAVHLFFGNRVTNKMNYITEIIDRKSQRLIIEEQGYGVGPGGRPFPENSSSAAASKVFFYRTLLKEIYVPVFTHSDSVYVLDHVNEKLVVFTPEGNAVRTIHLPHSLDTSFKRNCIQDPDSGDIYILFEQSGIPTLSKLNTVNGLTESEWRIPFPFPDHLTVRDGQLYYLRRHEDATEARILSKISLN